MQKAHLLQWKQQTNKRRAFLCKCFELIFGLRSQKSAFQFLSEKASHKGSALMLETAGQGYCFAALRPVKMNNTAHLVFRNILASVHSLNLRYSQCGRFLLKSRLCATSSRTLNVGSQSIFLSAHESSCRAFSKTKRNLITKLIALLSFSWCLLE